MTETKPNGDIFTKPERKTETESFEKILENSSKTNGINFSKHALSRMSEREIDLSVEELAKLNSAVEAAEEKGIRDSLILMNSRAFIVNIPSNVVITVMDGGEVSEQKVFTNLDGAVIL
ncbi:MAG: hypothetical protein PHD46_01755 [Eubacteriales bacterium]|nr:hypothetical protein [Eubacteriales bacterium]MDD4421741.1 hypothetical protein [Eubacteriales bacterium]